MFIESFIFFYPVTFARTEHLPQNVLPLFFYRYCNVNCIIMITFYVAVTIVFVEILFWRSSIILTE